VVGRVIRWGVAAALAVGGLWVPALWAAAGLVLVYGQHVWRLLVVSAVFYARPGGGERLWGPMWQLPLALVPYSTLYKAVSHSTFGSIWQLMPRRAVYGASAAGWLYAAVGWSVFGLGWSLAPGLVMTLAVPVVFELRRRAHAGPPRVDPPTRHHPSAPVSRKPLDGPGRAAGRVVAALLLPPALLVIGILAPLVLAGSPGPMLFAQERVGFQGRAITIRKLRTMTNEPEQDVRQVTGLGRILRPLRIDELPQLWSIVRGEMGWFGPRPRQRVLVEPAYIEEVFSRTRPGFFSTAAVEGGLSTARLPADSRLMARDLQDLADWSPRFAAGLLLRAFMIVPAAALRALGRSADRLWQTQPVWRLMAWLGALTVMALLARDALGMLLGVGMVLGGGARMHRLRPRDRHWLGERAPLLGPLALARFVRQQVATTYTELGFQQHPLVFKVQAVIEDLALQAAQEISPVMTARQRERLIADVNDALVAAAPRPDGMSWRDYENRLQELMDPWLSALREAIPLSHFKRLPAGGDWTLAPAAVRNQVRSALRSGIVGREGDGPYNSYANWMGRRRDEIIAAVLEEMDVPDLAGRAGRYDSMDEEDAAAYLQVMLAAQHLSQAKDDLAGWVSHTVRRGLSVVRGRHSQDDSATALMRDAREIDAERELAAEVAVEVISLAENLQDVQGLDLYPFISPGILRGTKRFTPRLIAWAAVPWLAAAQALAQGRSGTAGNLDAWQAVPFEGWLLGALGIVAAVLLQWAQLARWAGRAIGRQDAATARAVSPGVQEAVQSANVSSRAP
jgi:lipopolysaccharide/colanic/teichoic acid biosynthesis glycosyltransferase